MRALLSLVLLLGGGAGAARDSKAVGAAVMSDKASRAQLQNHMYEKEPMELAEAARLFLEKEGYAIPSHSDPLCFDSEWKDDGKGIRSRYHVQILALSTERAMMQLEKISSDPLAGHDESGADLDAAWTLLEKIEPASAKEIGDHAPALPVTAGATPEAKSTPRGQPAVAPTPIAISTAAPSVRATGTTRAADATRVKGTTPAGGTADAKAPTYANPATYAKPAKTAAPTTTPAKP